MICTRCHGLVVSESVYCEGQFYDFYKCLNCGDEFDEVVCKRRLGLIHDEVEAPRRKGHYE